MALAPHTALYVEAATYSSCRLAMPLHSGGSNSLSWLSSKYLHTACQPGVSQQPAHAQRHAGPRQGARHAKGTGPRSTVAKHNMECKDGRMIILDDNARAILLLLART